MFNVLNVYIYWMFIFSKLTDTVTLLQTLSLGLNYTDVETSLWLSCNKNVYSQTEESLFQPAGCH